MQTKRAFTCCRPILGYDKWFTVTPSGRCSNDSSITVLSKYHVTFGRGRPLKEKKENKNTNQWKYAYKTTMNGLAHTRKTKLHIQKSPWSRIVTKKKHEKIATNCCRHKSKSFDEIACSFDIIALTWRKFPSRIQNEIIFVETNKWNAFYVYLSKIAYFCGLHELWSFHWL